MDMNIKKNKEVSRSRKSNDRQYKKNKGKRTNNDLLNSTKNLKV